MASGSVSTGAPSGAAVGATATVGQLCLTHAFTAGQPAKVSVVGLAQVVIAVGLDLVFEHSVFDATKLAGIGLVMVPTAWVVAVAMATGGLAIVPKPPAAAKAQKADKKKAKKANKKADLATGLFKKLDTSKDGSLSLDEFKKLAEVKAAAKTKKPGKKTKK